MNALMLVIIFSYILEIFKYILPIVVLLYYCDNVENITTASAICCRVVLTAHKQQKV